ncbi:MarR family winged helix-turn-helix transcriptional regulator [Methylobacterium sp. NEAU 140]|uniref:MarR family winged helix-turn-helix transcriptional regulator n=1 Tax=Methylobacterium sp. NEAU 140 TaxID=3064945 RepID=UPI002735A285|nr:MarR family winged helix-turn-helix transcriptional regulator [Methylobacterium sp. NEAU 140]MDP4023170.1 MarR family winged helix-turn-helix transcriptional regulator [Methylobacterium sp. NEAU 140]
MAQGAGDDLSSDQYAALAAFRYRLRRFLAFSEAAAAREGLPPQQHQALLALAGHRGEGAPTVGFLAEQLLIAPHTAAELVSRMVEGGLLTKARGTEDRRRVELALTPRAEALLRGLTAAHLAELRGLEPALRAVLRESLPGAPRGGIERGGRARVEA